MSTTKSYSEKNPIDRRIKEIVRDDDYRIHEYNNLKNIYFLKDNEERVRELLDMVDDTGYEVFSLDIDRIRLKLLLFTESEVKSTIRHNYSICEFISLNSNITVEFIRSRPDIKWNFKLLCRVLVSSELAKLDETEFDFYMASMNKSMTAEFVNSKSGPWEEDLLEEYMTEEELDKL